MGRTSCPQTILVWCPFESVHATPHHPLAIQIANTRTDATAPPHFTVFLILGCEPMARVYRQGCVNEASIRSAGDTRTGRDRTGPASDRSRAAAAPARDVAPDDRGGAAGAPGGGAAAAGQRIRPRSPRRRRRRTGRTAGDRGRAGDAHPPRIGGVAGGGWGVDWEWLPCGNAWGTLWVWGN